MALKVDSISSSRPPVSFAVWMNLIVCPVFGFVIVLFLYAMAESLNAVTVDTAPISDDAHRFYFVTPK